jgi:hypothetical protein
MLSMLMSEDDFAMPVGIIYDRKGEKFSNCGFE